jgi:glutaredoxin
MELIVYSQANCVYCTRLTEFLIEKELQFEEFDINKDEEAYQKFKELGGRATPFIIKKVNGEIVSKILGFNKEKILKELE